jgi:hypothetical protein
MRRTSLAIGAVAALLGAALAAPTAASAGADPSYRSELRAGQQLVASRLFVTPTSSLMSPSGVFTLTVTGTSVELDEDEQLPTGTSTAAVNWWKFATSDYRINDRSTLTMQRNGDLVLRASGGRLIWHSNTASTRRGNYVQLLDSGDLVMRAASGKWLWSTQTTRTILRYGQRVASGDRLVNRYRQQFHITPTYLVMGRNGDLSLRWGTHQTWHTNTHVKGSHLSMTKGGRLQVVSPKGKQIWVSPASGRKASLTLEQCGVMELDSHSPHGRTWNPTHTQSTCG